MTAPMYTLLILTVLLANLPFMTQRVFGIIAVTRKHFGYHLIELLAGFLLTGVIATVLEQRTGSIHQQDWQFYAVAICLYLVFAFPAFVWRYFWHARNRE